MSVRYGLIGCGMMGREHLAYIALTGGAHARAIFEPDAEMAAAAARMAPDAEMVASIDDLLAVRDLDCLLIASPNHCHVAQLETIAASVTLPILVEKPLFTDPADLPRIEAFRDAYAAPVWVAMEYRYMPPMQRFLDLVETTTGGIRMLSIVEHRYPFLEKVGNWNRFNSGSGGTLVEKCCHFFDLMRLILKADPVRVMASAGQEVNHLDETYDGRTPDIWDCGYVIVDFDSGARAMLELSMFAEGSEYQEMVHAVGPDGKIEVRIPGPARLWSGPDDRRPTPRIIESPRHPCAPKMTEVPVDEAILAAGDHNGSTYHQHMKFLDVVHGKGAVEVGLEDGIWAVRMGQAAQESARTGMMVTL